MNRQSQGKKSHLNNLNFNTLNFKSPHIKKSNKIKILVVDDEKDIVELLKYNLEKGNEFIVKTAYDGKMAMDVVTTEKIDLILLDIMMPEISGFDVCKKLKSENYTSHIPVIFLTAKENEIDEINGLDLGADDYIQKPVSPGKVIARIKSVLRRTTADNDSRPAFKSVIHFKNVEVDGNAHSVRIDGRNIFFPKKEFQLLHFLLSNPGRVFTRETLLNHVLGENIYVTDRTIDVHIAKVREKLGEYSDYIETIKGLGYRLKGA